MINLLRLKINIIAWKDSYMYFNNNPPIFRKGNTKVVCYDKNLSKTKYILFWTKKVLKTGILIFPLDKWIYFFLCIFLKRWKPYVSNNYVYT